MPSVVITNGLVKTYTGSAEPAVDGIDFSVGDVECFGFLGPNGAGKTTIMQMICCRVNRTDGSLEVLGLDPNGDERRIKAQIGVVPQETNLDTIVSVQENLLTHAGYFGIGKAEARRRSAEVLGDRVVPHTEDGEALLKAVNDAASPTRLRPSARRRSKTCS